MGTRIRALRAALVMAVLAPMFVLLTAEPAQAAPCAAASQTVWGASCLQGPEDSVVSIEGVTYTSGALTVTGTVCRPKAAGVHPIAVINHSGFDLSDQWTPTSCNAFARAGYYTIAPHYRVYDPATNPDLLCDGEVDDVLAMLAKAKDHPQADDDTVVMRGTSHGGCVTLRAYQQGVPGLVAAAVINAPTDIDGLWQNAYNNVNNPLYLCPLTLNPNCDDWQIVLDMAEDGLGGTPAQVPAEYAERSVDGDLPGLHNADVPLMIAQGSGDQIVPIGGTCATVAGVNAIAGAPEFLAYHLTNSGTSISAFGPGSCPGFTWSSTPNPMTSGYPDDHYLFVYQGYGHSSWGSTLEYNVYDYANHFLVAKT